MKKKDVMFAKSAFKPCIALASVFFALLASSCAYAQSSAQTEKPLLMAAGSLKQAMDETMAAYKSQGGASFTAQYGPSGKLRQEIEQGIKADVFASASPEHVERLATRKLLNPARVFAHNELCAISSPTVKLDEGNLLSMLASPYVRVATSTPVSDPMGDYTWQFFKKGEQKAPSFHAAMDAKALKLSGVAAPKPGKKLPYVTAFEDDKADVYLMYCTNAASTKKALPQLQVLRIPADLNVKSAYAIAARPGSAEGERFVNFILGADGRRILDKHGFN